MKLLKVENKEYIISESLNGKLTVLKNFGGVKEH